MPLSPVGLAGVLIPSLLASGNIGIAVPQFSLGVATGVVAATTASTVISLNAGTAGPGVTAIPLIIPQPLLLATLLGGFAATATLGPMAPLLALGLANGLQLGFLQGLVTMVQPVGVGGGVAKVIAPAPIPTMIGGFASAGMVGPGSVKMATAIGIALTTLFGAYVFPVPILGPPSIVPLAGVPSIIGKIV